MGNRRILALVFEGHGSDTTKAQGLAYYFGLHAPVATGYEWVPALEEIPSSISTSVDPFTGDLSVSSFGFRLAASDRVARALMYEQHIPTHSVFTSSVAVGDTSITLDPASSYPTSGEVIWIGDEAIFIVSSSGAGLTTVQRGYWGTSAQAHAKGDGVFTRLPYWRGRVVRLVEHDVDAGTMTTRWRGLVTEISQDADQILVEATELLGALRGAQAGGTSRLGHGFVWQYDGPLFGETIGLAPGLAGATAGDTVHLQVDAALISCTYLGGGVARPLASDGAPLLGSMPPDDIRPGAEPAEPLPVEDVYDVLVWARTPGSLTLGERPAGMTSTPYHPLAVAMALLTSTGRGDNGDWDVLGAEGGLAVPSAMFAGWSDAIDAAPGLVIDRLVLGWDGEPWEPWGVAQRLMRAFGFFFGLDSESRLTPARLRMVTDADLVGDLAVSLLPDVAPRLERGLSTTPGEVVGVVGETPWSDGDVVTVRARERSRRAARLIDVPTYEIDLSMFDPARIRTDGGLDALGVALVGLLTLGLDQAPTLYGRIGDPAQVAGGASSLELGAVVAVDDLGGLRDAWLVDGDGERVDVDAGDVRWAGIVVSRAWDPGAHTYDVGLLLTSWRSGKAVKERAPAAIVGSGSTTGVVYLDTTLATYGDEPGLVFSGSDTIQICNADGSRITGTARVNFQYADRLDVTTGLSGAPTAGQVVRLAQSAETADDETYPTVTLRPGAYLAPDGVTAIEDGDGFVEGPDVYGTEVYGGAAGAPSGDATFVGVDSDALTSDSSTTAEPWDSWAAYTLRDNATELLERGHQVTWSPLTHGAGSYGAGAGHRPYASAERTTILRVPWLTQPGLGAVRASAIGQVDTQTASEPERELARYTIGLEFVGALDEEELAPADWVGSELAVDVSSYVLDLGVVPLTVWGESSTSHWDTSAGTVTLPALDGAAAQASSGTPYADTGSVRPNSGALDLQCTELANGTVVDHLDVLSDTLAATTAGTTLAANATRRHLPHLQLAALELHQTFVDLDAQSDLALRPRLPVLAEVDAVHLLRAERVHQRARPVWVGPQGDRPGESGDELWPANYTRRWVMHSASDSGSDSLAMQASVWLDTDSPRLLLLAYVLPAHYLGGAQRRRSPLDRASLARWDAWLTVEQLEDADSDWSEATSVGDGSGDPVDLQLAHYPSVADGAWPALYGHHLRRDDDEWTFREGQLYDADLALLQPIAIPLELDYDASDDLPLRVSLHLEHQSTQWVETTNRTVGALDLMIVGASIWEVPQ